MMGSSELHCISEVICEAQDLRILAQIHAVLCIRAGLTSKRVGDPTWGAYLLGLKGMLCHCDMRKHLALENLTCILNTLLLGDSNSGATFPNPVQSNLCMMRLLRRLRRLY